ncbi:hypothetical protein [Luteolibacter sp. AS25]|uniref:tetratricopeptide repeat protein n=1 Tax=Luteolibacter sp. AS25 TaxID=3135776 RepID=UPI00398BA9C0
MPKLLAFIFLLFVTIPLHAQEPEETRPEVELPSIDDCIPQSVKNLGEPTIFPFRKGLVTAISAASAKAQIHTVQGLNHLHGGWEFEATRHFAVALKEDPNCLMAHWGMIMAILSPSPETDANRLAASQRMLELVEKGAGTELERGYVYGLIKYIEGGPREAEVAFRKVVEKYPGEVQAEIFASLFGRGGYDEMGSITPDQEGAEKRLEDLMKRDPGSALPLHALLLIRAEAPDLRPSLGLARKLCEMVPDYAPYFHLLGHYEWRCGEHEKAAASFSRASKLYLNWVKQTNCPPADSEGWIRTECYRVAALASNGDFENALASAKIIANTEIDPERPSASGTRQILWDAKTLPARVLLRRNADGDHEKALLSLPTPEEMRPFINHSLSYWWVDGIRLNLEAQRLISKGNLEEARKAMEALTVHGQAMSKKQTVSMAVGERSEWGNSFRALEVLAAELRGDFALAGPPEGWGSALNWFRAATDRQKTVTLLSTPPLLTPMAMRLGDYYMARNLTKEGIEAYIEALSAFPKDHETLIRLKKAYIKNNQPAEADKIIITN